MRHVRLPFLILSACIAASAPLRAQLIDDWLVRPDANPDALVHGATAVFRNPSLLAPRDRGEAFILDVRGPDITKINAVGIAAAWRLDARTSIGAGYAHVGIDGIEMTTDAPDQGTTLMLGQDLFAVGAAHALRRLTVGANVQYLRASDLFNEPAAVRMGVGAQYAVPLTILPITIAGNAQSQDRETLWSAGTRVTAPSFSPLWNLYATYGATGGGERDGVFHRAALEGVFRQALSLQAGFAAEPEADGHHMTAIGSIGVSINRYELGVVRESLTNGFGAVHTFRIGMHF